VVSEQLEIILNQYSTSIQSDDWICVKNDDSDGK